MRRFLFIAAGIALVVTGMSLLYGEAATGTAGEVQQRDGWFSLYIAMIGAGLYLVLRSLIGRGVRLWPRWFDKES